MRKGPEEMLTHEQMCPNWSAPDTSSSKLFLKGVFFFFCMMQKKYAKKISLTEQKLPTDWEQQDRRDLKRTTPMGGCSHPMVVEKTWSSSLSKLFS